MGGIILRQIQKTNPLPNLGQAIMLGPPNRGSEVVDKLDHLSLFHFLNGPAASQELIQRAFQINLDMLLSN